jgi:hypothetical protein
MSSVDDNVATTDTPAASCAATAEVGHYRHDEMNPKPGRLVAHILVDIDEDQNAWKEYTERDIRPLRHGVRGKRIRQEQDIDQKHKPREKQRKEQEVEIYIRVHHANIILPFANPKKEKASTDRGIPIDI